MKVFATVSVVSAVCASAFVPQPNRQSVSRPLASEPESVEEAAPAVVLNEDAVVGAAPAAAVAVAAPLPTMSASLPFLERPAMLDGSMPGDVGFDPLGFAKSPEDLRNFREAEIKHARLAMLAAAGWPLSELWDRKIAMAMHLTPIVDQTDRAPSILNGGLGKISPAYWIGCLVAAAAIDVIGIQKSRANAPDYFPGNFGFDPLGLYPQDEAGQLIMQEKEIKNGRLAMIAVVAFAVQEFVQKVGVIDETPIFFKPIGTVMQEAANSGYIIPN